MADYIRGMVALVTGLVALGSLLPLGVGVIRTAIAGNWFLAVLWFLLWLIAVGFGVYFNRLIERQLSHRSHK